MNNLRPIHTFPAAGCAYVLAAGKWWFARCCGGEIENATGEPFPGTIEGWLPMRDWQEMIDGGPGVACGKTPCPYCATLCECDVVDVGVGLQQCGPYHCRECHASEVGPHDDPRPLTEREKRCGWYEPGAEPGSSANVVDGEIVTHDIALKIYKALYPLSRTERGQRLIRKGGRS